MRHGASVTGGRRNIPGRSRDVPKAVAPPGPRALPEPSVARRLSDRGPRGLAS